MKIEGPGRASAASGPKRSAYMPEVPTTAELGYPDVAMSVWYGLLAPAGTPRGVADRVHADTVKVISDPEFREKEMISKGYEPSGLGSEEFRALIRRESEAGARMVKISGARLE